ncbi:MAG: hypothetical protein PHD83_06590 [Caldisericia bacterium]|nr:hypothetical protein [Caldisericia bacterium]
MKQSITVLLVGLILINPLYSCKREAGDIIQQPKTQSAIEQSIQPIDLTSLSDKEIEWKTWESSPIQIEAKRYCLYQLENDMSDKMIKEESEQECILIIEGYYPQLRGLANKPFQDQVNKELYNLLLYTDDYAGLREYVTINTKSVDEYFPAYSDLCYHFTYTVPLISEDLISILFQTYYIIGPAGAYQAAVSVQIDLKNQQIIKQPSVLFSSPHFWETIKPYFFDGLQQLKAPIMDHATVTDSWLNWDNIQYDISFAFLPDALLIVYNENESYPLQQRWMVEIPYEKIPGIFNQSIVDPKSWKKSYSFYTTPSGWERYDSGKGKWDRGRQYESEISFMIKYPNTCSLQRDQATPYRITLTVPDTDKNNNHPTTIEIDSHYLATQQEGDWMRIQGLPFYRQTDSTENKISYVSQLHTPSLLLSDTELNALTRYEIRITVNTTDSTDFRLINQILGTLRVY